MEAVLGPQDSLLRDLNLAHTTEGEKKFHQILCRHLGGLADDCADGSSNRGLKRYRTNLHSGEVHTHALARLEHDLILTLR